jgi:hypothetical protein
MARMKGVFSWEDVLAQRYQSKISLSISNLQLFPFTVYFYFYFYSCFPSLPLPSQIPQPSIDCSIHSHDIPGNKPPPLPRKRPQIQCPQPQPQSRLLARLSPELRLMIWEYVLGGQRIHIIQKSQQRLGHVLCPLPLNAETTSSASAPESLSASASASRSSSLSSASQLAPNHHTRRKSELFCEICHGCGIPQPAKEGDLMRRKKTMLLGLALSCRLMYVSISSHSISCIRPTTKTTL